MSGLVVLFLLGIGCREESRTLRIGYMICNSLEETRERFEPLTAYLSQATGARCEPVYLDTQDVEDAFAGGKLDLVHTNSLLYVILRARHGAELVAADRRGTFGALARGVIVVRADSEIQTLADLKGKRLVFGPQWAPFGFLAPYALLLDNGLDPETDLGLYAFPKGTWKHEKIIYSVLYGAYAAGAAPLIDLEEMAAQGRIAPDDLRVIARSDLAPYCTVSAHPGLPVTWRERVRQALLQVGPETMAEVDGERLRVLQRGLITGFEALQDADYDTIRGWARTARMPPYEQY
ncbi:MAG: phosphate/phosphite/phosphonate ABC transporter substrate-binding protein [Deferrisomatales bacterium]|nr:phosphate/phosphite/phosphonate ABC transporter substrate-binding protein [Deferrisomatales bacterium]